MFSALRFMGKLKRVTVSRTAHRWFVSLLVDTEIPDPPRETRGLPVVGIDVGIHTLATLDDGEPEIREPKTVETKRKEAHTRATQVKPKSVLKSELVSAKTQGRTSPLPHYVSPKRRTP